MLRAASTRGFTPQTNLVPRFDPRCLPPRVDSAVTSRTTRMADSIKVSVRVREGHARVQPTCESCWKLLVCDLDHDHDGPADLAKRSSRRPSTHCDQGETIVTPCHRRHD